MSNHTIQSDICRSGSSPRAAQLLEQHQQRIYCRTDRMFAGLMLIEWLFGIAVSLWLSPRAWAGISSRPHFHVWAAVFLGGIITLFPVTLARMQPGKTLTRHAIAIGQMLMSGLLIHLTGGRIETHFHVFGSLAFLAFYRDWRVLLTGTLVTTADHAVRGLAWPQSLYGIDAAENWRWLEHAAWVLFENFFLLYSCALSVREMRELCERDAQLEENNADLQGKVAERTRQIEYLAYHDTVTNLPNRLLFQNQLDHALAQSRRTGKAVIVMYLDLDNFKRVNDTLGHEAGDILLKEVAARLGQCVRETDTLARLGGDEFILLLEGLSDPCDARVMAERILESLAAPILLPQGPAFIGTSIGIVCATGRENADVLIRNADTAMYHAKSMGKGVCAFFTPDMNDRAQERIEIEMELRQALRNNELRVFYQPLLNLATGKLRGMEALARWQHPVKGLVSPATFIPVAEEVGLIGPLGYWMLEASCRQLKAWLDTHREASGLIVNVNLSGKQLQQPDVVTRVREILNRTGLPPEQLKLEITESVFLGNAEEVSRKLQGLKELGVKLAIDDFGTGYSSMSALSAFPVDTIKIDQAFIKRLNEEEGMAMVAAIISLSKAMHLEVTSEGVETAEQVAQLQGMSCDTAQGYFFARPMPAGEMEQHLKTDWTSYTKQEQNLSAANVLNLLEEIMPDSDDQTRKAA